MATIVRPPVAKTSFFPEKRVFLVYNRTVPYTCRVNDRTSLVIFPEFSQAYLMSQMLESHYTTNKHWPDISDNKMLLNYRDVQKGLSHLKIKPIDPYQIFHMCLRLNVNACVVEEMEESDNQLRIRCSVIDIYPSSEDFKMTLEDIYLG